jgi:hypothetical protein
VTHVTLFAALDEARRNADPPADAIVTALGRDVWAVNALLAGVSSNTDALPAAIPPELHALVRPELPRFADPHRLRRAQTFAERHLALVTVALFCASLPASYGAAEGARVLEATGRLRGDLDRRINETARFVLEVLRPHGFDAGGRARVAIGKVRLIHAAVRSSLRNHPTVAAPAINQEDMLGTMCLFSVLVLDSLRRLGVEIDPRDAEDYLHLWIVVGAMLGIDEHLLPQSLDEGHTVMRAIRERCFRPTESGRALMRDLLAGMERHTFGFRDAPVHLVHHLIGKDAAEALGVPPISSKWAAVSRMTRGLGGAALDPAILVGRLSPLLGRRLLEAITSIKLQGARVTFPMPASTMSDEGASPGT